MADAVQLVEDNSLQATGAGFEVKIRLLWYRSLPLSCIDHIQLSLDGQAIDPGFILFGINGHQYMLEQLADLVEEYWFIQDSAILSVKQAGVVVKGQSYTIGVDVAMRFPYIPIGPGKFLTNIYKYSATQVAN